MPDLDFRIERAEVLDFAAAPTLVFKLCLESPTGESLRSITLNAQIRIATPQRPYSVKEQTRLSDLFGESHRWGDTLKSLLWAQSVVLVPPFTGRTTVDLPVACTYDFEVVSAKYFHGLDDGEIPLEFLFSGAIFYQDRNGALQIAPIPWEKEARFRLPVSLWKQVMESYFPNSAWLRLRKDTFDRLYLYKIQRRLPTWEAALEELLRSSEEKVEP